MNCIPKGTFLRRLAAAADSSPATSRGGGGVRGALPTGVAERGGRLLGLVGGKDTTRRASDSLSRSAHSNPSTTWARQPRLLLT